MPVLAPLDHDIGFIRTFYSMRLQSIANTISTTGQLISWPSPCGLNCSYTVSFVGPAYHCVEFGPYSSIPVNLTDVSVISTNSSTIDIPLFINSSLWYWGVDDLGNETRPMGLWIVYDSLERTVRCTLHNATYTTNVSYSNNVQSIWNTLEVHDAMYDSAALHAEYIAFLESANLTDENAWRSLNIFAIHTAVANLVVGWMAPINGAAFMGSSIGYSSGVVDWSSVPPTFPDDLPTKIEDLLTNTTLSLIDLRNSKVNVSSAINWHFNLSSKPILETLVPATINLYPSIYTYSREVIWQIYAPALGVSLICVILGSFMLHRNGLTGPLSFSQVLITTRNLKLDETIRATWLGGKDITDQVQKMKVRYGKLVEVEQVGFGTKDNIEYI